MRIDTLEAPRLPAAHHPTTESDTGAFCRPRMGSFADQEWEGNKPRRKKKKKPLDKGYD
jgi:hypothetical protein